MNTPAASTPFPTPLEGQFRKKPVVIEAFCLGRGAMPDWFRNTGAVHIFSHGVGRPDDPITHATINTLEGEMRAESGDWIIRGIKGEMYPCKPDIFAATYDPADSAVPLTQQEGKWISVMERVPNIGDEVLTYAPSDKFRQMMVDEWGELRECPVDFSTVSVVVGEGWGGRELDEVTHWMPLPAAPVREAAPDQQQGRDAHVAWEVSRGNENECDAESRMRHEGPKRGRLFWEGWFERSDEWRDEIGHDAAPDAAPEAKNSDWVNDLLRAWNDTYPRMNIRSAPGTTVVFDGRGGYDSEKEHAAKKLTLRGLYTVESVNIGGSSSTVKLVGIPGVWNTCLFSAAPLPASGTQQGDAEFVRMLLWDEFPECCGVPVVGAEYMGQREEICCGNPEPAMLNEKQIVASLRARFPAPPAAPPPTELAVQGTNQERAK